MIINSSDVFIKNAKNRLKDIKIKDSMGIQIAIDSINKKNYNVI